MGLPRTPQFVIFAKMTKSPDSKIIHRQRFENIYISVGEGNIKALLQLGQIVMMLCSMLLPNCSLHPGFKGKLGFPRTLDRALSSKACWRWHEGHGLKTPLVCYGDSPFYELLCTRIFIPHASFFLPNRLFITVATCTNVILITAQCK